METINKIKSIITTLFGLFASIFGSLALPILLLVSCNIIDYITAVMASPKRGQRIDSNLGIAGIKKKVSMWLLIVVAAIVDYLILYTGQTIGIQFPFRYLIACIVAIWLICNEILSILENIKDTGTKLPLFLEKIVVYIKSQIEETAEIAAKKESKIESTKSKK